MKTPQDQVRGGRGGGGDFTKHTEFNDNSINSCVLVHELVSPTCQMIHNSLSGVAVTEW